jgi:hypothetical protein
MLKKRRDDPVKLSVCVTKAEDAAILLESKVKRRITKQDWLAEAVREYLRGAGVIPGDAGPLAGLSPEDQRRVQRYIDLLNAAGEDRMFRVAVDSNIDLFERLLSYPPRTVPPETTK